jgi:hypothetical protein
MTSRNGCSKSSIVANPTNLYPNPWSFQVGQALSPANPHLTLKNKTAQKIPNTQQIAHRPGGFASGLYRFNPWDGSSGSALGVVKMYS